MIDPDKLAATVQHNCHISDARFAGNYTLCIFLLKMREYFRWEHGIPLTEPLPRESLGEWLTAREARWDELEAEPFKALEIDGQRYDAFDSSAINGHLNPIGYVYSAGYGLYNKPCFFLARLERKEDRNGNTLYLAARELARDLAAPPAMLQGHEVFIRRESLRRFIWERMEELDFRGKADTPMARAVACHEGESLEITLDRMTDNEIETLILHEDGEALAREFLGQAWEEMLLALPRSRTEFLLRAVRDNYADCQSTLPRLIEKNNHAALHFFFANLTGMRKEIFPTLVHAYHDWLDSGSLETLENLCERGRRHWRRTAEDMLQAWREDPSRPASDIEQKCRPL